MSSYFFDSSALIKRYVIEQGTDWVRTIIAPSEGNSHFIGQITPVEIVSGAERLKREGKISPHTARVTRLALARHTRYEYILILLTEEIIERAEDLLVLHQLRAYDAVQLATALVSNKQSISSELSSLIFVSADKRLLTAASAEGLETIDPNQYA